MGLGVEWVFPDLVLLEGVLALADVLAKGALVVVAAVLVQVGPHGVFVLVLLLALGAFGAHVDFIYNETALVRVRLGSHYFIC